MAEQCYGNIKISYVVTHRNSKNRIQVFVFHDNETVRNTISKHIEDPTYFLDIYDVDSDIMAEKWMARLVRDYRKNFELGLVDFTLIQFDIS